MTSSAYHHGHLREALVDAAVEAVREEGATGLALRELARRVGVSHNAAYRHFANRDELLDEVGRRVMARLVSTMERRLDTVDTVDPVLRARRRLAETGRAYVEFARTEPGLFRLAFANLANPGDAAESDPYLLLGRVLDDLVDVGFLSDEARVGAEVTCWSAVHGFSVLAIEGAVGEARDEALETMLVAIDRSYGATSGSSSDSADL